MSSYFHVKDLILDHDFLFLESGEVARDAIEKEIDTYSFLFDSLTFSFSSPATRNLYHSGLFNLFCSYFFLIRLWEKNPCNVIVDSKALKDLLQYHIDNKKLNISIKVDSKAILKKNIRVFGRILLCMKRAFQIKKIADKHSMEWNELKKREEIRLIDTYALNGSFSSGKFKDRYFGEFFSWFKEKHLQKIIVVPNILAVENLPAFDQELKEKIADSGFHFFFKEKALTISDYIFTFKNMFASWFLSAGKNEQTIFWPLIKEDLYYGSFTYLIADSFLTYSFTKKLIQENISVKTFLEWNENHLYDRAYAKAHFDFKGQFRLKAYQAVVLDIKHDFFILPSAYEKAKGLVAPILCLTGKGVHEERKAYLNGVNVEYTPLFRMNKVLGIRALPSAEKVKILVALSLFEESSRNIISLIEQTAPQFPEVDFIIRCHPLLKLEPSKPIFNVVLDTESDSLKSLVKSHFLITSATSVCLEAAAIGLKSIIVREEGHLPDNRVPQAFQGFFTREIATTSQLCLAIKQFLEQKNDALLVGEYSEKIKEDYIMQVTDEHIDYFLDF